jgi:ElaB/YqjD/DUF883 family membrane-anchored ribosome-binding protein
MDNNDADGEQDTAAALKPDGEQAGTGMHDTARRIGGEAAEMGERVYEQGARGARYVGRHVEAQPLASLAIVGAVGFLLGFLVGQRS